MFCKNKFIIVHVEGKQFCIPVAKLENHAESVYTNFYNFQKKINSDQKVFNYDEKEISLKDFYRIYDEIMDNREMIVGKNNVFDYAGIKLKFNCDYVRELNDFINRSDDAIIVTKEKYYRMLNFIDLTRTNILPFQMITIEPTHYAKDSYEFTDDSDDDSSKEIKKNKKYKPLVLWMGFHNNFFATCDRYFGNVCYKDGKKEPITKHDFELDEAYESYDFVPPYDELSDKMKKEIEIDEIIYDNSDSDDDDVKEDNNDDNDKNDNKDYDNDNNNSDNNDDNNDDDNDKIKKDKIKEQIQKSDYNDKKIAENLFDTELEEILKLIHNKKITETKYISKIIANKMLAYDLKYILKQIEEKKVNDTKYIQKVINLKKYDNEANKFIKETKHTKLIRSKLFSHSIKKFIDISDIKYIFPDDHIWVKLMKQKKEIVYEEIRHFIWKMHQMKKYSYVENKKQKLSEYVGELLSQFKNYFEGYGYSNLSSNYEIKLSKKDQEISEILKSKLKDLDINKLIKQIMDISHITEIDTGNISEFVSKETYSGSVNVIFKFGFIKGYMN